MSNMSNMPNKSVAGAGAQVNTILRTVYLYMTLGLALTGVIALMMSQTEMAVRLANSGLFFVIVIGQLGLVIFLSARINKMSPQAAMGAFFLYAGVNGLIFSSIFLAYTGTSIAATFFITAGTFAAMSLYALNTKEDLTKYGRYLYMALIGLIIASVVNLFVASSALEWIISYAGVLIFVGLTAYDTQQIARWSNEYSGNADAATFSRLSVMGALKLYLDFINLFLFMLRIFGGGRG